jgi:hypothetical protein
MLCKIWGFHASDYEKCRLLGCDAVWVLSEQTFQRTVSPPSSGRNEQAKYNLTVTLNWSTLQTHTNSMRMSGICYMISDPLSYADHNISIAFVPRLLKIPPPRRRIPKTVSRLCHLTTQPPPLTPPYTYSAACCLLDCPLYSPNPSSPTTVSCTPQLVFICSVLQLLVTADVFPS